MLHLSASGVVQVVHLHQNKTSMLPVEADSVVRATVIIQSAAAISCDILSLAVQSAFFWTFRTLSTKYDLVFGMVETKVISCVRLQVFTDRVMVLNLQRAIVTCPVSDIASSHTVNCQYHVYPLTYSFLIVLLANSHFHVMSVLTMLMARRRLKIIIRPDGEGNSQSGPDFNNSQGSVDIENPIVQALQAVPPQHTFPLQEFRVDPYIDPSDEKSPPSHSPSRSTLTFP
ncbi:hypothetical protein EST38_g11220 [Candolleomyces aberdarensis]|uniref:Uncharacterized protein n=1 Tax=Candolleomyces aberdarensis TaxID=2316362 RepID=A0A4Q2D5E1_9AGAR|nr:hypothetical protein EST38_g11220 [Candolleomyces aberdarensis]